MVILGQITGSAQKLDPWDPILGPKQAIWAQESQNKIPNEGEGFIFENFQILKVQL